MENQYDYTKDSGLPEMRIRLAVLEEGIRQRNPSGRILEVGIGSGDATLMLTEAFSGNGASITCVDSDAGNLATLQSRLEERGLPAARTICSMIETAPLPAAFFDHIVLFNVLEHLEDPVAVLSSLKSCAALECCFHISVPLAGSIHRWLGVEMGMIREVRQLAETDYAFGHHRVYTIEDLLAHMAAANLGVQKVHPFYLKPLPTATLSPLSWELHLALNSLGSRFPEFASYVYLQAGLSN